MLRATTFQSTVLQVIYRTVLSPQSTLLSAENSEESWAGLINTEF